MRRFSLPFSLFVVLGVIVAIRAMSSVAPGTPDHVSAPRSDGHETPLQI
jgi:hypothetical protein